MPIGPDLLVHNLNILAARLGWPDEARDECQRIIAEFPGWSAHWYQGDLKPRGFYANRENLNAYGVTAAELREQIARAIREDEDRKFLTWQDGLYRERGC